MPFGRSRSRSGGNQRRYQHAPAHTPPMVVTPPRRSLFKDAAAVAGGVTVGTTMGHVAGEAITSLFGGGRRREVEQILPRNYDFNHEPTGPCAYEISQFLNCAANRQNLEECAAFNEALKECKRINRIP
ncbi:uncharacterized protein LOC142977851 isoform X2 [Anticarsia gemmatalis]|uniref:uncharacterized protein LOC142977851 isoform X2 n=1 Tax=Anticarsia gemmatalis TaxID=129554 RepID=UPI003F75D311